MQAYHALDDGEPNAGAARVPCARFVDPKERVKEVWQRRFRDAGTKVADDDQGAIARQRQDHSDLGLRWSVKQRVAQYVLQSDPQQRGVPINCHADERWDEPDGARGAGLRD